MTDDMIERVARAIFIAAKENSSASWEGHIPEARAAIAAMREPTEEMMLAGERADEPLDSPAYTTWRAMIDAALKGNVGKPSESEGSFTLVFKGDIRQFPHPITTDSPWGRPYTFCVGDALARTAPQEDQLFVEDYLQAMRDALKDAK
jgi:hypothetical protein